ncbi:MAG: diacylglycerol kinase family protein [Proteobacteria bacterium]|nr:diacylglycerol kinase family protein [Pseudomonadota bacterium]
MPRIDRYRQNQPVILFGNPTAQSGKAADWIRHARALLDEAGVTHRFIATEPEGRTTEIVRKTIDDDGTRVVIYMGGDGTFAEVAKGILRSAHAAACVMGMLPTGTANDQGKSFGLEAGPGALGKNVEVIAAAETVGCDVGMLEIERSSKIIHRDMFFDSFSVGLGAASLETRNRDRERVGRIPGLGAIYRDQLVYAGAIFKRFAESYVVDVKFDVDAVLDGRVERFENLLDIIIKNTKIFGGEWVFDANAESDDGLFELIPIAGRRDFGAKILGTLRGSPVGLGDLEQVGIEHSASQTGAQFQLDIHTEGALPAAQVDGEEIPAGDRYRVIVLARALRLIVPREHVDPSHTDMSGPVTAGL